MIATQINWEALGCDPNVIVENCGRIEERFIPTDKCTIADPVAVVAYGPSLTETWEELRDYNIILTCSGAHKFLVDRGIIPTYHIDSDPRPHKIAMLGDPHEAVTYLPASSNHRNYFDRIDKFHVKLWHILFNDDKIFKMIPNGDWILTGGTIVGPRTIRIARMLGATDLHLYGFDGSGAHAGEHTNKPDNDQYRTVNHNGKTYEITANMIMQTAVFFQDLNRIPNLKITFHGDGLVPALARDWKYNYEPNYPLALVKHERN